MLVQAVDDINLKILNDPQTPERNGHFILWPNSVRRDVPMGFSLPPGARIAPKMFGGELLSAVHDVVTDKEPREERKWNTRTKCPLCRMSTESGTHNGCGNCRRVKHTMNGKRGQ